MCHTAFSVKIFMFLRCQNHLIEKIPKIQMRDQGSPQIQGPTILATQIQCLMILATYICPIGDWDQQVS